MKIAVIGAGRIGGALGKQWAATGHEVVFGVRNTQDAELQELLASIGGAARATDNQTAISQSEVLVFSIPGSAMLDTLAGLKDLDGKILIDCTNGLGNAAKSGAQQIAEAAPRTIVYKAFNSVGFENLSQPYFGDTQSDMFFCGADGDKRQTVASLISDIGFRPLYLGDLSNAGMVEMLARLWGSLSYGQKMGRRLAFKMLSAEDDQ